MVGNILRIEGLSVLIATFYFYNLIGESWLLFILLFFIPDISMIGYLKNKKIGSAMYNLIHNYVLTIVLIIGGILMEHSFLTSLGLVLSGHIGMDRFFGFGLKYPNDFKHTHIQKV